MPAEGKGLGNSILRRRPIDIQRDEDDNPDSQDEAETGDEEESNWTILPQIPTIMTKTPNLKSSDFSSSKLSVRT